MAWTHEECLIWLHIPKTAGTTVMTVLEREYGSRFLRLANRGGWRRFGSLPERSRRRYRCIMGHMPWGLDAEIPGPAIYATMLREPVDRVVSLWRYIRTKENHAHYSEARDRSLMEFVLARTIADVDNGMVRFLSGRLEVGGRPAGTPATWADLGRAMAHLDKFAAVGFVSQFDKSIAGMAARFGWGSTDHVDMLRQGPAESIGIADLARVSEMNALDRELYAWAIQRFGAAE